MLWLQYSSDYILKIANKRGKEEKNGIPELTACNGKSTGCNIAQQVDHVLGCQCIFGNNIFDVLLVQDRAMR